MERRNRQLTGDPARELLRYGDPGKTRTAGSPLSTRPLSVTTITLSRVAILLIAPAVLLTGSLHHPWLGNPNDVDFLAKLAAAVAINPTHWAIAHLLVAIGSGLIVLAFLAIRSYLREAGEGRWSALGLPFIVMGSVLYALLPAMEFAPLAASGAGVDAAAVQAALLPWFTRILLTGAAIFAVGAVTFAIGIARSGVLSPRLTWPVVGALLVMAAARFFPVGAVQLYVSPAAGILALWPLAYLLWTKPAARSVAG